MEDGSRRSLPSNTEPESPGNESQGLPNRSRGQAYQSPHASLEGVRLNARRISSFTTKQHTTRITGQGVTKVASTVHAVKHLKVHTLPWKD